MILTIGILLSIYFLYMIKRISLIIKKKNYYYIKGKIQNYEKKAKVSPFIPKTISNECCLIIKVKDEEKKLTIPRFELSIYKLIHKDMAQLIGKKILLFYQEGEQTPFHFLIERSKNGK